jgi:adenine-specific DNA-methyltransferase
MMEKITTEHPDSKSLDILADNIEKLKEIFPEVVSENRVDFEKLQLLLNDAISPNEELYGLNWWGKNEAIREAMKPSLGTLRPCKEESVNWDTTENLHIEGDNLEVLKLLQKSYNGKVKMIYIDPPYNTGKDFVYKDNFKDNLKNYLAQTGQIDEEGEKQSTNTKDDGRYHDNWLNMMYPRLKLARNLMTEDGVIFISIDDNEVDNLVKIGKEIFGEKNYLGNITWLKKRKGSFLSKKIISITEYCIVFSKNTDIKLYGGEADKNESQPLVKRTNPLGILHFKSNSVQTKLDDGKYQSGIYGEGTSSVELLNDIEVLKGKIISDFSLKGPFIWGQEYLDGQIENGGKIIINTLNFQVRAFKAEDEDSFKGLLSFVDGVAIKGTNEDGYEHLRDVLEVEKIMDYPKPINYLKKLINSVTYFDDKAIVLDFFSGSASTSEAITNLNSENGSDHKYIMVQLPEPTDEKSEAYKAGYKSISEIGKERIRRAGNKILKEKKEALKILQDKMILTEEEQAEKEKLEQIVEKLDIGFKVFKLDSSNIEAWDTEMPSADDEVKQKLEDALFNIKEDRKDDDLLYEFLLKQGHLLTAPILEKKIDKDTIYNVNQGELFICLTDKVTQELINTIGAWAKECLEGAEYIKPVLILKDNAFLGDDALKTNTELTLCSQFGFAKINTI